MGTMHLATFNGLCPSLSSLILDEVSFVQARDECEDRSFEAHGHVEVLIRYTECQLPSQSTKRGRTVIR